MKSIYQSKTFWVNVLGGILMLLESTEITSLIPPEYVPLVAAAGAALNVLLRRLTSEPVMF